MNVKTTKVARIALAALFATACSSLFAQSTSSATKTGDGSSASPKHEDEIVVLSPFVVTEQKDEGYRASNSIGGTKINVPIREIPMDIQVITEDFIKDIGAVDDTEMLQYQANVQITDRSSTDFGAFQMRGYKINWTYREGVRRYDLSDAVNIARAEVVAGPAAIFYGYSQPGGLINTVNKKPSFDKAKTELGYTFGSYNFHRATFDANSPLLNDKVAARFMASFTSNENYMDWYKSERSVFAPVVTVKVNNKLSFTFDYEYLTQKTGSSHGKIQDRAITSTGSTTNLPYYLDVDMERQWTGPDVKNQFDARNFIVSGYYTFNKNMSLRIAGSYYDRDQDLIYQGGQQITAYRDRNGALVKDASGNYIKSVRTQIQTYKNANQVKNVWADWVGAFKTGPMEHMFLLGAAYTVDHQQNMQNQDRTWNATTKKYTVNYRYYALDDLDPDLRIYRNNLFNDPMFYEPTYQVQANMSFTSWYAHYRGAIFDRRIMVIGGVRYDDDRYWAHNLLTGGKPDQNQDEYSPQFGFLVRVAPWLTLYGLHSTSLDVPPFQSNSIGEILPNKMGSSMEGGAKFDFFNKRLSGALSVYNIKLKNIALTDPNIPNLLNPGIMGEKVTVGEQTSEGVDFSVNCSPFTGYQITGGWSYVDTYISKDTNPANIGRAISPQPYNRATFWNNYRFTSGPLTGLSVGCGVAWTDQRVINTGTAWLKPDGTSPWASDYLTASAAIRYSFKVGKGMYMGCSLNISNLTDELDMGGMAFLQPRSFRLAATLNF